MIFRSEKVTLVRMVRGGSLNFCSSTFSSCGFLLLLVFFFIIFLHLCPVFILWWLWRPVVLDCSLNKFTLNHLFFACSQTLLRPFCFILTGFYMRCLACLHSIFFVVLFWTKEEKKMKQQQKPSTVSYKIVFAAIAFYVVGNILTKSHIYGCVKWPLAWTGARNVAKQMRERRRTTVYYSV